MPIARKCFLIILVTLNWCYGQRQTKERLLEINGKWNEGKILLKDNNQIAGLVSYNYFEGIVHFRSGSDMKTFTAKNLLGFDFYDDDWGDQRDFRSIPFDAENEGVSAPTFFEILIEFKHFALLSRLSDLETVKRTYPTDPISTSSPNGWVHKSVQQKEIIYIFDDKGKVRPYMMVIHEEGVGKKRIKSKEKVLDGDLLKEYLGKSYAELEIFAKEHDLSFKKKDDLLEILDQYQRMLKSRK